MEIVLIKQGAPPHDASSCLQEKESSAKKEPVPRISENGREMLALYEKLSERDQLLLLGRLQEMASPMLGDSREKNQKDDARSAAG